MRKFMVCKGYEKQNVILPVRSTKKSAGYDFKSLNDYIIKPHENVIVETGVKAAMEDDEVLKIYPRSSLSRKKGLRLSNSVAIIDADYFGNPDNDGDIAISVYNFTDKVTTVEAGERIAQGIFEKYLTTDDDKATGVRKGGFGSTGKI
jgi:dUTP pyrophosphatase